MINWLELIDEPKSTKRGILRKQISRIVNWPLQNFLTLNIIFLILALLLGFIGYSPESFKNFDLLQVIYDTLRLWVVHDPYKNITTNITGSFFSIQKKILVDIANILTLVVSFYFLMSIVVSALKNPLKMIRIKRSNSHVVICGLSDKGFQLAKEFCLNGAKVIIIEHNSENDLINLIESYGALVYVGDGKDKKTLYNSRVFKAKYVISVSNDDLLNIGVAWTTYELCEEYKNHFLLDLTEVENLFNIQNIFQIFKGTSSTKCIIHLNNLDLETLIEQNKMFENNHPLFEMLFFNINENIARYFLLEHPPYELIDVVSKDAPPIHFLISKFNDLAEAIIIQTAKICNFSNEKKIHVTICDPDCEQKKKQFFKQYPKKWLEDVISIEILGIFYDDLDLTTVKFKYPITSIIICENDDVSGLKTSLQLLNNLKNSNTNIYAYIKDDQGLDRFLKEEKIPNEDLKRVHPFGMKEKVTTIQMIVQENINKLAREIHEDYLATSENIKDKDKDKDRTKGPWWRLPYYLKQSNMDQADHIPVKLHLIHAEIRKKTINKEPKFEFTAEEVEMLARAEHNRWIVNRKLSGWVLGEKEEGKKTSPYMKDYDLLDESTKEFDREPVKNIPKYLEGLNLEIVRKKE